MSEKNWAFAKGDLRIERELNDAFFKCKLGTNGKPVF